VAIIFVTHDQEEDFEVADRVAVLNGAALNSTLRHGSYTRDRNAISYIASLDYNTFAHREFAAVSGNPAGIAAHTGTPHGPDVFVRPHETGIAREDGARKGLAATVSHIGFAGSTEKVELRVENAPHSVDVELSGLEYRQLALEVRQRVVLYLRAAQHIGVPVRGAVHIA
jgi:sulfate transport system ATP-binding protein